MLELVRVGLGRQKGTGSGAGFRRDWMDAINTAMAGRRCQIPMRYVVERLLKGYSTLEQARKVKVESTMLRGIEEESPN